MASAIQNQPRNGSSLRHVRSVLIANASGYVPQKKPAETEKIPAWIWSGHKVAYQLNFTEISKLGVISGVGHIPQLFFKNTMFFPISINRIIFLYNSRLVRLDYVSLVPTPCMEHSTCTHTANVVARVGMGGGEGGTGGVFTAVHLHPVEERLSRNEGCGCLALVDGNLILYVVCSRMFSCSLTLMYFFVAGWRLSSFECCSWGQT